MEYNYRRIGEIIVRERNKRGWSQSDLIDELSRYAPIARNRLSELENGKAKRCDFILLASLCKLFECEMAYLLGESELPTKADELICSETNLSYSAVAVLRNLTDSERKFLESMLTSRADLYFVASAFEEYRLKKTLNHAIDCGDIPEDFGPDTLAIKNGIDYARFTLVNRFLAFAEKEG